MSIRQKIAQLIIVKAKYANKDELLDLLSKETIGGIMLMTGTISKQCQLINTLQTISTIPLLTCQDAEWGFKMRLVDAPAFPKNMALGAIQDISLLSDYGYELGLQAKTLGINMVLGPVVDTNTNPLNPIIGLRSFGDKPALVTTYAKHLLSGMHAAGITACLKHFPGHGDVAQDSHLTTPSSTNSRGLEVFAELVDTENTVIMTAHVKTPWLQGEDVVATISHTIVTNLLKNMLGFKGLIITDCLNMGAIKTIKHPGVKALQAGCDLLLAPHDTTASLEEIAQAVATGTLSEEEIGYRCLRVLKYKELLGLTKAPPINQNTALAFLHRQEQATLRKKLFAATITTLNNEQNTIPLAPGKHYDLIVITPKNNAKKQPDTSLVLDPGATDEEVEEIITCLKEQTIVLRIHSMNNEHSFLLPVTKLLCGIKQLLYRLQQTKKEVILILATTPYALAFLPRLPTIVAYEATSEAVAAAMAVLVGNKRASGVLPITLRAS
jgi:beta-N-acetylhexosaminidase